MGLDIIWVIMILAVVAIMVGICIFFYAKNIHNDGKKAKYDERQMVARGRGYKYAFYSTIIVGMLPIFLPDEIKFLLGNLMYCIPLLVGLAVHIFYCIWNDAYLELNLDSKRWMTSMSFISVANLLISLGSLQRGFLIDGVLNTALLNLAIGILGIVIIIEILMKKSIDKKKEADEDEEFEA